MSRASRFLASAMIAGLAVTRAAAADFTTPAEPLPPPPPMFYVHAGALGIFFQTNSQPTGGGTFPTANIDIHSVYTLSFESGYFFTPNIALALSTGVPPIEHIKATGLPSAGIYGSNLLGSTRSGAVLFLLQYHFNQFGALQPYAGIGGGYMLNFGNISDGILTRFSIDQNFAFVLQAGTDWMLTPNWGVFVDGKKVFLSTVAQGFSVPLNTPVRGTVTLDPWVASAGVTFKY